MTTFVTVLLVWAGLLALLVGALALATRHRRSRAGEFVPSDAPEIERRLSPVPDRRRGEGDRRIGLPDLRSNQVERRAAQTADRRSGTPDRRGTLTPV